MYESPSTPAFSLSVNRIHLNYYEVQNLQAIVLKGFMDFSSGPSIR